MCPGGTRSFREALCRPSHTLIVPSRLEVAASDPDQGAEIHRVEWADPEAPFEMLNRDLRAAKEDVQPAAAVPRPRRVGVENQGLLETGGARGEITGKDERGPKHRQNRRIIAVEAF